MGFLQSWGLVASHRRWKDEGDDAHEGSTAREDDGGMEKAAVNEDTCLLLSKFEQLFVAVDDQIKNNDQIKNKLLATWNLEIQYLTSFMAVDVKL
jgi:hypothetical protein